MTMAEYIDKLKKQAKAIQEMKPLKIAVQTVLAEQVQRIFIRGENSNGGTIGTYNTINPLYVNPNTSPVKFRPAGKPGANRNIEDRKTRWFASYRDFRSTIGRKTDRVNLSLSNDLQSDFSSRRIGKNPPHNPEKISNTEYHVTLKRPLNVLKKSGMEEKYGDIFRLTSKEKKLFHETAAKEFALIFE